MVKIVKQFFAVVAFAAGGMFAPMVTFALAESDGGRHHLNGMKPGMKWVTRASTAKYALPQVMQVRDDGKVVSLPHELNDGRPVILGFIYTFCNEVCPVSSYIFAQLQGKLESDKADVHLVSISIDPEQDTPAVLREYARLYGAGSAWQHYTGTLEASIAIRKAFKVYGGDKMSYTSVTLLRATPGKPWLRIDGFASADDLLRHYRELTASR